MWETILNLQQSIEISIEKNTIIFLYQKILKRPQKHYFTLKKFAFLNFIPEPVVNKLRQTISLIFKNEY